MIQEIPFQYDLDNEVVELKFQSELSKIVKHYDSLTIAEEAEAVKILLPDFDEFPRLDVPMMGLGSAGHSPTI